jgi:hypothetical protein
MPLPLLAIGLGAGLLGQAFKFGKGLKQDKLAKKVNPQWKQYMTNPFAKARLGMAQQLFNSRMAGAANQEKNIASSQGNQLEAMRRGATDGAQLLAASAGVQGQADQAFSNLQTKESQNQYAMLGNLNDAYETMLREGDKEHGSLIDKYQMDVQEKNALRSSAMNNQYGAINDFSSMLITGSQLGGGGNSGRMTPGTVTQGTYTPTGTARRLTGNNMTTAGLGANRYRPSQFRNYFRRD